MKTLFVNDTSREPHLGCRLTVQHLKLLLGRSCELTESISVGELDYLFSRPLKPKHQELIEAAELVVINGEGSIHSDNCRAMALLKFGKLAKTKFCKQVWLVNHSALNLSAGLSLYKYFDHVAVRELLSFSRLTAAGISAALAFDCAILQEIELPETVSPDRCGFIHGQTSIDIESHAAASGLRPLLIDCCFDANLKHRGMEFDRFVELVAQCRYVVSSSFHGCILSILAGKPFVAVPGLTPKNEPVFWEIFGYLAADSREILRSWQDKAAYADACRMLTEALPMLRTRATRNLPRTISHNATPDLVFGAYPRHSFAIASRMKIFAKQAQLRFTQS